MTAARGTSTRQMYAFTDSHPNGFANLNVLNVLINRSLDGGKACYLACAQAANQPYLVVDRRVDYGLLPLWPPTNVANSQYRIHGESSSFVRAGSLVTLNLDIEFFSQSFGRNSTWLVMGTLDAQW